MTKKLSKSAMMSKRKNKHTPEVEKEYKKPLIKKRKPNRSIGGDIALYFFLLVVAFIMAFPIIYAVSSALKPLTKFSLSIRPLITSRIYLLRWESLGLPSADICLTRYLLPESVQPDILSQLQWVLSYLQSMSSREHRDSLRQLPQP